MTTALTEVEQFIEGSFKLATSPAEVLVGKKFSECALKGL
jgi:hypothetical protein